MAIKVGEKVSGKVTGITNFGAFVDLGDHKTGLVHISEISDKFIKDIHDVLKVDDVVTVKVISIGDDGKIGLSIRKAQEHPKENYHHENHESKKFHKHNEHSSNKNFHGNWNNHSHNHKNKKEGFDEMMSDFLKQSENRLAVIKKNTEGKRGGRGGRRS